MIEIAEAWGNRPRALILILILALVLVLALILILDEPTSPSCSAASRARPSRPTACAPGAWRGGPEAVPQPVVHR
ncbi:hypothetical protein [Streptomyces novaecaesareae]|uniref:hypothetical protein n=1 Tax=Streptomyces novaecaesareae TaxID=68244 RepID=UPI001AE0771C|nr:hypothetical protein [Streptomyces novaecaesareae]